MKSSEWGEGVLEKFRQEYDFARCQRPDGTFYGTSGTCRKGSPVGAKETDKSVKEKKAKIQKAIDELREKAKESYAKGDYESGTKYGNKALELSQNLPMTPTEVKKDKQAREESKRIREKYWQQKDRSAKKPPEVEISDKARAAIKDYTEDKPKPPAYKGMNNCGRGKTCSEKSKRQTAALDSALQELPANTSGGSYFRGFNASVSSFDQLSNLSVGDSFSDGGFGSFSRDPSIAQGFAGGPTKPRRVIIESRSTSIRSAEQFSRLKKEQEGILPRNVPQTVRSVEKDGDTLYITVD